MRVGLLHSLSGVMATSEVALRDAELLAIAEINRAGGVLGEGIQPIIEDGASDPVQFKRKARKLIQQDGVATVFGCWTSDSRKAVLPVVEELNALLWYPVRYEGLECSRNIFYTGACPNQQVEPALDWLLQNQHPQIFLLGSDHAFARTVNTIVKAQLKQRQGRVVGECYLPLGGQDFTAAIAQIQQLKPDAILSTIKGSSNRAFYEQYREAGFSTSEMPTLSISVMEAELHAIGAAAGGHYLSWSYFQDLDTSPNQTFVRNFRRQYGADSVVNDPVEAAYTQVYLWKQAVETAQSFATDRVRVAAYGQTFAAPSGLIRVEPNHHICKPCRIGKFLPTGKVDIVFDSRVSLSPLPWLGIESLGRETGHAAETAIAIEMLAEVSQGIGYSCQLEQKSRELDVALGQLKQEVDERQRVEERLRLLESVVVNTSDAVMITEAAPIDLPGPRIIYINQAFTCMTGYSAEDVIGQSPRILQSQRTDRNQLDKIRAALTYQHSAQVELVNQRKNGTEFWVEMSLTPITDDSGQVTHYVSIQRNITDRKRTEAALRQSEATNRALIATIPDLLIRANREGRYVDIEGRDRLLIQQDSLFSVGSHVYDSLPPDLAELRLHYIRQALETGEMQHYEQQLLVDGRAQYEEVRIVVSGEEEVLIIVRDITDRKQAEAALRQSEATNRAIVMAIPDLLIRVQ
ncbi:MAG: transporter substrate-binding protein, partial [Kovacikia sp.]